MNNPGSHAYIRCLACRALSVHPAMVNRNISILPRDRGVLFFSHKSAWRLPIEAAAPIDTAHIEFAIVPAPLYDNGIFPGVTRMKLGGQLAGIDDAHALAQAIVDTVREPLLVLDRDLRVVTASRSFYLTFRVNRQE